MKEFYLYYEDEVKNQFVIISSETNIIKKVTWEEKKQMNPSYCMMSGYEPTKEGLATYMQDFKIWVTELARDKKHYINVLHYNNLHGLVYCTFKRFAKGYYEHHEKITAEEIAWFDMCYNAGLQYCDEGTYNSYGYDFELFYLNILDSKSFMIPTKPGKATFLNELPKMENLQEGFYRVRITSENENFKKIFAFSKHHVYHYRSLYHALKYKDEFDVDIKLIKSHKTNAYLYDEDCLQPANKIFHDLKKVILYLKRKYPKNRLVKFIGSGVWGHLSMRNTIFKTSEEIESEKIDVGFDDTSDYIILDKKIYGGGAKSKELYELLDSKSPLKTSIRLKPFLTAYARNKTARVALKDIDNVIRIHTDGLVFKKKHDEFITEELKAEDKTTGKIKWTHCNEYKKID